MFIERDEVMRNQEDKSNLNKKVKINYNEEIETDTFDYFEDDDPYKEIIVE